MYRSSSKQYPSYILEFYGQSYGILGVCFHLQTVMIQFQAVINGINELGSEICVLYWLLSREISFLTCREIGLLHCIYELLWPTVFFYLFRRTPILPKNLTFNISYC